MFEGILIVNKIIIMKYLLKVLDNNYENIKLS